MRGRGGEEVCEREGGVQEGGAAKAEEVGRAAGKGGLKRGNGPKGRGEEDRWVRRGARAGGEGEERGGKVRERGVGAGRARED